MMIGFSTGFFLILKKKRFDEQLRLLLTEGERRCACEVHVAYYKQIPQSAVAHRLSEVK